MLEECLPPSLFSRFLSMGDYFSEWLRTECDEPGGGYMGGCWPGGCWGSELAKVLITFGPLSFFYLIEFY